MPLPSSFFNQSDNENDDFQHFINDSNVFRKLVRDSNILTPEEINELETDFLRCFPNKNLENFLIENNITLNKTTDVCTDKPIYDTKLKKYYNPNVLNPIRRSKSEDFNLLKFLRESIQNQQVHYLDFDPDPEIDINYRFDDKNKEVIVAHQALKSIATMALCINQQRKELPYAILEVNTEKYIN